MDEDEKRYKQEIIADVRKEINGICIEEDRPVDFIDFRDTWYWKAHHLQKLADEAHRMGLFYTATKLRKMIKSANKIQNEFQKYYKQRHNIYYNFAHDEN